MYTFCLYAELSANIVIATILYKYRFSTKIIYMTEFTKAVLIH